MLSADGLASEAETAMLLNLQSYKEYELLGGIRR
jgi:hypothetical protein